MKIIDLLIKISKGEKVPKKIKYDGIEFEYSKSYNDYVSYTEISSIETFLIDKIFKKNIKPNILLNDEIEIIEENKKIKMLEPFRGSDLTDLTSKDVVLKNNALIELCKTLNNINNKVNELICEANKLRGEK